MKKIEKVWIVIDYKGRSYVDFRFTKRDMIRCHIDSLGYPTWKQAYDKGDRVVKATLTFNHP